MQPWILLQCSPCSPYCNSVYKKTHAGHHNFENSIWRTWHPWACSKTIWMWEFLKFLNSASLKLLNFSPRGHRTQHFPTESVVLLQPDVCHVLSPSSCLSVSILPTWETSWANSERPLQWHTQLATGTWETAAASSSSKQKVAFPGWKPGCLSSGNGKIWQCSKRQTAYPACLQDQWGSKHRAWAPLQSLDQAAGQAFQGSGARGSAPVSAWYHLLQSLYGRMGSLQSPGNLCHLGSEGIICLPVLALSATLQNHLLGRLNLILWLKSKTDKEGMKKGLGKKCRWGIGVPAWTWVWGFIRGSGQSQTRYKAQPHRQLPYLALGIHQNENTNIPWSDFQSSGCRSWWHDWQIRGSIFGSVYLVPFTSAF